MTEIEYYELLKKSLPEEAAKATVAYIGDRSGNGLTVERVREVFATKEDLARFATKEDSAKMETVLSGKISTVREEVARVESSLTTKIYTIGIGIGLLQMITIVGAILAIIEFAGS